MTTKRLVFLKSLRNSVFGSEDPVPSTSCDNLDHTESKTEKKKKTFEENQQTYCDLYSDLLSNPDDSDEDPNFKPCDSSSDDYIMTSDSDFCLQDDKKRKEEKKKKKKKSSTSVLTNTQSPHNILTSLNAETSVLTNIQCAQLTSLNDETCVSTNTQSAHLTSVNAETSVLTNPQSPHVSNYNINEEPKKRRKSDPATWKRNYNKARRLKGQEYVNTKGKTINARQIKPPPCRNKTNHQCSEKIPEQTRQIIFEEFHSIKTLHSQREFLVRHIKKDKSKRKTVSGDSRKQYTKKYYLSHANELYNVCREFFLTTLGISEGLITGAFKKLSSTGKVLPDARGGKRGFYDEEESFMEDHIKSFPALESHYCRSSSDFKYLDSQLNIKTMYSLYKEKCENLGKKTLCYESYRKMFKSFKLKFHSPKKDICKTCIAFKECSETEKALKQETFNEHLERKNDARKRRDQDKESAIQNNKILSINFDLQSVLSTPKGAAGPFFYVRKLAIYNLTIYNLGNSDVNCYTWDETEGKRGSSEISTCIYKYVMSYPEITHLRMMSDGCPGQQKNVSFSLMCMELLKMHPTLKLIDHVYFESGHSQMECDSIHSKIEQKSKNVPVYTHEGWAQVMRMARNKPAPFTVTLLKHNDFLDFNPLRQTFAEPTPQKKGGQEKNEEEEKRHKIKFSDAVWFQYRKSEDKLFIKSNYREDGEFNVLVKKLKRGRHIKNNLPVQPYKTRLGISLAKKKDLLLLCKQKLIPTEYHDYYEQLPTSNAERDCLPQPDYTEEDDDNIII